MPFDHQPFLKQLTQRPGIYQMMGEDGAVLYVGKAKNLRKRLASYFRTTGLTPKTAALVSRIANIDVTITQTEIEALLLEQNLIKQNRPPFNILLRDDKSYPYLFLSDRDTYPRLAFHRGSKRQAGRYFGPFPSVQAVRDSLNFLQKTFRVRQCDDNFFRNRSRPCLQYQINRCTAPCVELISEEDYQRDVRHTQMFLEGKNDNLIRELEADMDVAAEALAFERAALLRDQMVALRTIQAEQVVESGSSHIDVVAAMLVGDQCCVHVLYIRQGRILGSRSYYPKVPLAADATEVLTDFLPQFYLRDSGRGDFPREIVVNQALPDSTLLASAISEVATRCCSIAAAEAAGHRVLLKHRGRSTRAQWVELAERTASQNLNGRIASRKTTQQRLEALQQLLQLAAPPERIECFDISHSSGEDTVASCVVFDSGGALKSDYRRMNIKDVAAGDDYAAMEQALVRRYTRIQKEEGKLPDILLIDGGKGQMRRAVAVLAELGVIDVQVVGVAKGPTRKAGFETLLLSQDGLERELEAQSSALLLIQQIRDEAHRFAITGHRQRRDRKRRTSTLEGIDGVGPKRRKELLRFFGGSQEVVRASVAELMRVPGISRKVAETIYSTLHNE